MVPHHKGLLSPQEFLRGACLALHREPIFIVLVIAMARLPGNSVTSYEVTKLQRYEVTKLQIYEVTKLQTKCSSNFYQHVTSFLYKLFAVVLSISCLGLVDLYGFFIVFYQ